MNPSSALAFTSWRDRAACAGMDPALFFPEKGPGASIIKRVCARCPVRAECLEHAVDARERWGVWGGMAERERRKLIAARATAEGVAMCRYRRHVKDEANTGPRGRCMDCKRESDSRRAGQGLAA